MSKKLFLLDGHALVYRAHYAFIGRPLINSKGLNTSAISGFTRTLWDIINNEKPSHIAVAFDLHGPTFRHKDFPEYKANREAQPEDITIALPYIEEIVKAFNIPIITAESYEADDVIGTLAKQAARQGFDVYMVTPDKDYGQLVEDHIFMYRPSRQGNGVDILGPKEIIESWGIKRVDQVIDMLGLMGDAVDNIPGIPGVGEKTAAKLLQEFDTVENLLQNKDKVAGKLRDKITEHEALAICSKQLATISLNAPVTFDDKSYRIEGANKEKLGELFRQLEFRTLAQTILGENNSTAGKLLFEDEIKTENPSPKKEYRIADHDIHSQKHEYHAVVEESDIQKLISHLRDSKTISFDTETTGIDPTQAELVGMSFATSVHEAYYVPVPADQKQAALSVERFKSILEDETKQFIGQNIKFDMLMMKQYGVDLPAPAFDTMIAHYLLEPDQRHKLDYLSESYLNYKMVPIEDLIGKKGASQKSMRDVPLDQIKEYASEDADVVLRLEPLLQKEIKTADLEQVMQKIELPLTKVLCDMEHEGVRIDPDFLKNYSLVLTEQILKAEQNIYKHAGVHFNISSPKQVGDVLFVKMKIPYKWRMTSTNQFSTDEEILNELAQEYEIVNTILEYRKLSKLKSTYVDALPEMVNPRTGRVHSSFNQARAATGRLASENPNLQNIPIKDEAGREIRKAFRPRDTNHIILSADYSQIELRLIADLSAEEAMLEAFIKGQDIHRATAAKVYNVPYDEVSPDQRRNAKTVNFSILYGAGATNISRQLGIPRNEAKDLIDQYYKTYSGLRDYMNKLVEDARVNGYVSTMLGRKRILRDINSRNALARSNAERVAVNTPIQGTAADLIKMAMIRIHERIRQQKLSSRMILQVHDELVFDVLKPELELMQEIVQFEMKNAIPGLKVPLDVGMGHGENWLEAH